MSNISPKQVRRARRKLSESTAEFAGRFMRSPRTVEDWEQGRRVPDPLIQAGIRAILRESEKSAKKDC